MTPLKHFQGTAQVRLIQVMKKKHQKKEVIVFMEIVVCLLLEAVVVSLNWKSKIQRKEGSLKSSFKLKIVVYTIKLLPKMSSSFKFKSQV